MNPIILAAFAYLMSRQCFAYNGTNSSSHCSTKDCKDTATNLLQYVDLKANPCDDFYEFACGTFLKTAEIPNGAMEISTFEQQKDLITDALREILENTSESFNYAFEDITKMFYNSCINVASVNWKNTVPIELALKRLDDWPLLEDRWKDDTNLTVIMSVLQRYRIEGLFTVYISGKMPSMPTVRQPKLTLPVEDYKFASRVKYLEKLKLFIIELANTFFKIDDQERVVREAGEIVNFEKKLAMILVPKDEDLTKISLAKFAAPFKKFQFDNVLTFIFNWFNVPMTSEEPVVTPHMSYFNALVDLVEKTSHRALINYLLWRMVFTLLPGTQDSFRDLYIKFKSEVMGEVTRDRPEWCTEMVYSFLENEMDALYVAKFRKATIIAKVNEIYKEVKAAFENVINQTTWVSNLTRKKIFTKFLGMREVLFNPPQFDPKLFVVRDHYTYITSERFLDNILEILSLQSAKVTKHLALTHDFMSELRAATPSSAYLSDRNVLWVSAARISWPMFSEEFPMYMNFGGIGFIIGHHILDALNDFKDNRKKEKKKLNWKSVDIRKFRTMSKCFVEQYDGLAINETIDFVDGRYMLSENIVDNGAIKIVFKAYKNWLEKNSPEQGLPNFPYSSEQMFFINFGRAFCRKTGDKLILRGLFKKHAPRKYRVNPPLMNLDEFSEVFNCPKNSPMNPEKKCRIW